jgi:hypothetical protein
LYVLFAVCTYFVRTKPPFVRTLSPKIAENLHKKTFQSHTKKRGCVVASPGSQCLSLISVSHSFVMNSAASLTVGWSAEELKQITVGWSAEELKPVGDKGDKTLNLSWDVPKVDLLFHFCLKHGNHPSTSTKLWTKCQDDFFKQPCMLTFVAEYKPKVSETCNEEQSIRRLKDKFRAVFKLVKHDMEHGGKQQHYWGERSELYKTVGKMVEQLDRQAADKAEGIPSQLNSRAAEEAAAAAEERAAAAAAAATAAEEAAAAASLIYRQGCGCGCFSPGSSPGSSPGPLEERRLHNGALKKSYNAALRAVQSTQNDLQDALRLVGTARCEAERRLNAALYRREKRDREEMDRTREAMDRPAAEAGRAPLLYGEERLPCDERSTTRRRWVMLREAGFHSIDAHCAYHAAGRADDDAAFFAAAFARTAVRTANQREALGLRYAGEGEALLARHREEQEAMDREHKDIDIQRERIEREIGGAGAEDGGV